jgi:hypothetical protein
MSSQLLPDSCVTIGATTLEECPEHQFAGPSLGHG